MDGITVFDAGHTCFQEKGSERPESSKKDRGRINTEESNQERERRRREMCCSSEALRRQENQRERQA